MDTVDTLSDVRSVQYGTKVSKALLRLAEGWSLEDAARHARVLHVTLACWMKDEDFMAVVTCLQEYAKTRQSIDLLEGLTDDALAALRRTMHQGTPGQALEAARDVLNRVDALAKKQEEAEQYARREARAKQRLW